MKTVFLLTLAKLSCGKITFFDAIKKKLGQRWGTGFFDINSGLDGFVLFTSHSKTRVGTFKEAQQVHAPMFDALRSAATGRVLRPNHAFMADALNVYPSLPGSFDDCFISIKVVREGAVGYERGAVEIAHAGKCTFYVVEGHGSEMKTCTNTLPEVRYFTTPIAAPDSPVREMCFPVHKTMHIIYGSSFFWKYANFGEVLSILRYEPSIPQAAQTVVDRACMNYIQRMGLKDQISGSYDEYCKQQVVPLLPSQMSFGVLKVSVYDIENNPHESASTSSVQPSSGGLTRAGSRDTSWSRRQREGGPTLWNQAAQSTRHGQRHEAPASHTPRRSIPSRSERNRSRSPHKNDHTASRLEARTPQKPSTNWGFTAEQPRAKVSKGGDSARGHDNTVYPPRHADSSAPVVRRASSPPGSSSSHLRASRAEDIWASASSSEEEEPPFPPRDSRPQSSSATALTSATSLAPSLTVQPFPSHKEQIRRPSPVRASQKITDQPFAQIAPKIIDYSVAKTAPKISAYPPAKPSQTTSAASSHREQPWKLIPLSRAAEIDSVIARRFQASKDAVDRTAEKSTWFIEKFLQEMVEVEPSKQRTGASSPPHPMEN